MLSNWLPDITRSPWRLSSTYPEVPSNRVSSTNWPAPRAVKSIWTNERDLLGTAFRTSTDPVASPPGVDSAMVPMADRDFTLASAARPPMAVTDFSMTSSAVWAHETCAQPSTTTATTTPLNIALMGPPSSDDPTHLVGVCLE